MNERIWEENMKDIKSFKLNRQLHNLLDLLIRVASLELVASSPRENLRNLLRPANDESVKEVPQTFKDCRWSWTRLLWRLSAAKWPRRIRIVLLIYLNVKLIFASYLLFRHDVLVRQLRREGVSSNMSYLNCSRLNNEQMSSGKRALFVELQHNLDTLSLLGIVHMDLPGIGIITTGIVGITLTAFYPLGLLLISIRSLRVDHLAFLIDPEGTRRRMEHELAAVTSDLLQKRCVHDPKQNDVILYDAIYDLHLTTNRCSKVKIGLDLNRRDCATLAQRTCAACGISMAALATCKLEQVAPANLSQEWHQLFSKVSRLSIIASLCIAHLGSVISTLALTIFEIFVKTQHRLASIECQRKRNGTLTPTGDDLFVRLNELKTDEQLLAYATHDDSLLNLYRLVFLYEAPVYLKPAVLLYLTEYYLALLFMGLWSSFWFNMFLLSSLDKRVLVGQLRRQLSEVTDRVARRQLKLGGDTDVNDRQLTVDLTLIYLNFELMRRQNGHHRQLSNTLLIQVTTIAGCAFALCYTIAVNVDVTHVAPLIYSTAAVVATLNLYLLVASYHTRQIERIMRDVARLLARCSYRPTYLAYPASLWRRQLMTDEESRELFAVRLWVVKFSYSQILTFNIYLGALWLMLIKLN